MSRNRDDIAESRRRIALEEAPITRELDAAEAVGELSPSTAPASGGRAYWRSLGERMRSPAFLQWAHDEFPELGKELEQEAANPSRRKFLQLMGASLALAGLGMSGCRKETQILPYKQKPVDVQIGKGTYYASSFVLGGEPTGVLALTHEGRPTKIEGNPLHPNSLGGTDLFAQAAILQLYDPERSREYLHQNKPAPKNQFVGFVDQLGKTLKSSEGAGLAILMPPSPAPALELVLERMNRSLSKARAYAYEPLRPEAKGARAVYDFSAAKVILSLDADIFGLEDAGTRYRRQFAKGREVDQTGQMNQLYVIEPAISCTGAIADHRLGLKASAVPAFAKDLLTVLEGKPAEFAWDERARKWLEVLAHTLRQAGEDAVVVAGSRQGPAGLALAQQINRRLGSLGKSVNYYMDDRFGTVWELAKAMGSGEVKTLVILGGNPAYDAPAELKFSELLKGMPLSIRLGEYDDQTSALCTWHVPENHFLESWGDARADDGTISAIQPMISPLFDGMTALELLARITSFGQNDPYEITRMSFRRFGGGDEDAWTKYLQEGIASKKSRRPEEKVEIKADLATIHAPEEGIEICFAADPSVYDGRFANNAWLQECPDPITKLTWDNAAIIGPPLAERLGVKTGDVLRIESGGAAVEAAAYVLPGVCDNSITLPLGYGQTRGGSIRQGAGFDAYPLRTSASLGFATGVKVSKTDKRYPLATTQEHWAMDLDKHFRNTADEQAKERAIIREGTLGEYQRDPAFAQRMGEHAPIKLNIFNAPPMDGANQWAMIVDLNACVGCNACVLACQAENNVPVVGKDEVIRGREMHWLRLDRYFSGDDNQTVRPTLQPMMCQHCDNAPCEPVCPVNATVHSPEGLNEMVYNRCIGTRYCSNNCPYKVRRFNFFDWNKGTIRTQTAATRDGQIEPDPTKGFSEPQLLQPPMQEMLKMAQNPNVTVRIRGVMEKCTFCVQRIEAAKIAQRSAVGQKGDAAGVKVPQGAVVSACAQVCPTQAIVFGDKDDPQGPFAKRWAEASSPRSYQVLEHLNVRPRTHYQAKIRNVNPLLEDARENEGRA